VKTTTGEHTDAKATREAFQAMRVTLETAQALLDSAADALADNLDFSELADACTDTASEARAVLNRAAQVTP